MMNSTNPTLNNLFEQLGLAADEGSIDEFIETHKGLSNELHIENAEFWTSAQASFIKNALTEDAEWAELIDQLNSRLHLS
jgi:hypothetical protein